MVLLYHCVMATDEGDDATVVGSREALIDVVKGAQRDRAYLIVIAGHNVGEMYRVADDVTIGRGSDVAVRIPDDEISRRHARLGLEGDQIYVEDLGSTNGTLVNGKPVARRALQDGDKIQVGTTTILKFTYHDDLEENFQRQMYESALRDSLTQAYNKKYLSDRLQAEFAYAQRHKTPLSLVLFDLDYFKRVNDTHGHPAGDHVLTILARHLHRVIRNEDVFARYGGEEFALLSRGIPLESAQTFAERVRASIEALPFVYEGTRIPVTISVGLAAAPRDDIRSPDDLIAKADEALYEAKRGGRNRVCVSSS